MKELVIDNKRFELGESGIVKIPVGQLPSDTDINVQAHIFRARQEGPTILLLAGVHGDEINGIEIIRNFLYHMNIKKLFRGSLIVIPVLNIFGFINFNRSVPDGKDVNRSFPGSFKGSLASRIARTLTQYILPQVDYIFDFHTGGDSRYNYPQLRYTKFDSKALELAKVFNAPFIIESGMITKSLRKACKDLQISILVYEGGESVRLDGYSIKVGIKGIKNCLSELSMIPSEPSDHNLEKSVIIDKTSWIRAEHAGVFIWEKSSGVFVNSGEVLGNIYDPYGKKSILVKCKVSGYIIGHNNASVVNYGDALFHIGYEKTDI